MRKGVLTAILISACAVTSPLLPVPAQVHAQAPEAGSSDLPPDHRPNLPPYTPNYAPKSGDERDLWMFAANHERELQQSPQLIRDPALNAYVRRVLCETVGTDRCEAVRIYLLDQPIVNAGMAPNGAMTVWTGLLLRTRSEAELGAVLGHEFAHFELRHSLGGFKVFRAASSSRDVEMVAGKREGGKQGREKDRAALKQYFRYNREQEEAADLLGLQYLASSRYPSAAAAWNWDHQIEEADATAAERRRNGLSVQNDDDESGFYDTHPSSRERGTKLSGLAAAFGDDGEDPDVAGHMQAIRPYLPRMLAGLVQQNDFGATEYLLKTLATSKGWDADLLYARAENFSRRGQTGDHAEAAKFYREAMAQGLTRADIHRDLGISLVKAGQRAEARGELATYLQLVPNAPDAPEVRAMMEP